MLSGGFVLCYWAGTTKGEEGVRKSEIAFQHLFLSGATAQSGVHRQSRTPRSTESFSACPAASIADLSWRGSKKREQNADISLDLAITHHSKQENDPRRVEDSACIGHQGN